ncbi:sigma-54-dependent Fis family transcriptional regulator [candidate division TA06 bacterium]|nr:sigma-54-dependent Fis family transcriptional regulator [candidate division TA06 bacterium]
MAGERILIVDNEPSVCEWLSIALKKEGYEVSSTSSSEQALHLFKENQFDCVITDILMPKRSGLLLLRDLKTLNPEVNVVMITAFGSLESAIEALRGGAQDYLLKPFKFGELKHRLGKIFERDLLKRENIYLKRALHRKGESKKIIGNSKALNDLMSLVDKIAKTESTILITGESGTGKELVAKEIHRRSPRASHPFVTINCGAMPETLLESELFGHKRGAYTGAVKDKDGLFQVAQKGSFFLDEVGETSLTTQVKLLRVIQEREIIPLGDTHPTKVDVRVIAATNENLEEKIRSGGFRKDLFYRLNVIPVQVPPLRERKEDVPLLVEFFIKQTCERLRVSPKKISPDLLEVLMEHDWPGNIRELENAIERACVLVEGDEIRRKSDLPENVLGKTSSFPAHSLKNQEQQSILSTLQETHGNIIQSAESLGIHPSTLYRKMRRYKIKRNKIEN